MIIPILHCPIKTTSSNRPFAEGIVPVPLGTLSEFPPIPAHLAARPPYGTPLEFPPLPAAPAPAYGTPTPYESASENSLAPHPAWAADLRMAMRVEGYAPHALAAAVEYVAERHTVIGCDVVDIDDWAAFNWVLSHHFSDAVPTDAVLTREPSAADRQAWAAGRLRPVAFRFAPDTPDHEIDRRMLSGAWNSLEM